jgi:hypothetical protein
VGRSGEHLRCLSAFTCAPSNRPVAGRHIRLLSRQLAGVYVVRPSQHPHRSCNRNSPLARARTCTCARFPVPQVGARYQMTEGNCDLRVHYMYDTWLRMIAGSHRPRTADPAPCCESSPVLASKDRKAIRSTAQQSGPLASELTRLLQSAER